MRMIKPALILSLIFAVHLYGQEESRNDRMKAKPVNLSGPRIGATYFSDAFRKRIEDKYDTKLKSLIAQFGWQFEKRFFTMRSGATAVTEWVLLIGGFEQEKFLPSLSWLIGMRTSKGIEFGAGPNLALSGTSVVFATGITLQSDEINFPINMAVSVSQSGLRYSLLFGFNMRQD